jgi:hypothetical protein
MGTEKYKEHWARNPLIHEQASNPADYGHAEDSVLEVLQHEVDHGATRDLARHLNDMRGSINFTNEPQRALRDPSMSVESMESLPPMLHHRLEDREREHEIEDVPEQYFELPGLGFKTALTAASRSRSRSRDNSRAGTPLPRPPPSLPPAPPPDPVFINDLHEEDAQAAQQWEANRQQRRMNRRMTTMSTLFEYGVQPPPPAPVTNFYANAFSDSTSSDDENDLKKLYPHIFELYGDF